MGRGDHVVVCGGAGALGRALARQFLERSCQVTVVDIVEPEEGGAAYIKGDLTDAKRVQAIFATELANASVLINCVGMVNQQCRFLDKSDDDWTTLLQVNVLSYVHTCREFLALPSATTVVNVSSVLGLAGVARMSDYCASKAAINSLTESLRLEFPRKRFLTVCPFMIQDSPLFAARPERRWSIRLAMPWLTRPLTAEQVALAVVGRLEAAFAIDAGLLVIPGLFRLCFLARFLLPSSCLDWCQSRLGASSSVVVADPAPACQ